MKKIVITSVLILGTLLASPASALAATLSLSPSTGSINRGCNFSVNIELDTATAQTDGTDVILRFDTTRINGTNVTGVTTTYPDFPGNNIDNTAGKITVSGLASISQAFSGKGILAKVDFSVLPTAPTGLTQLIFDFDPNDKTKTTDSNVVERGTVVDVLSSVVNGNYTIGSGTTCAAQGATTLPGTGLGQGQVSTPSAQPVVQQIPTKTLPPAGSEQLTFAITIVGATLVILGILGLAIL